MTPERWQQVQDVLEGAFELAGAERATFVAERCGEDAALRAEVLSMLDLETQLGGFIEEPIFDVLAEPIGLEPGTRLGPYAIVSEIGHGGMGTVYLAERADDEYQKQVAIKLLKRGLDTDELVRRFRAERQILARLDHPNIARLIDGGTTADGRPYLVMEHVAGRPIDAWCNDQGLGVSERLRLFVEVCRAVHFAHRNLVVHRDLKPGNILITAEGVPKLLDFGIAKLLEEDAEPFATVGPLKLMTLEFASPEQVRGEPVTTATDVYSLGVLLYRLLAGRSPYRPSGDGRGALVEAVCEQAPTRPSAALASDGATAAAGAPESDLRKRLRGDLDTIVLRALHKEPERRYESAEQLAADVKRHLDGLPVLARPDSVSYRIGKFVRRHPWGVGLSAAAIAAVVVFAIVALVQKRVAVRERSRAQAEAARAEQEKRRAQWFSDVLTDAFESSDPRVARGRQVMALDVLDRARESLEDEVDGPAAGDRATLLAKIARIYGSLGEGAISDRLFDQAVALESGLSGRQSPAVAGILLNQALNKMRRGDDEGAIARMGEGLRILDRPGSEPTLELAEALTNLGVWLRRDRRFDESEKTLGRALAMKRDLAGEDSEEFAVTLSNLAELRLDQRRFAEAESLYRRSLAIREQIFPAPSIEIASAINSLAAAIEGQDEEGSKDRKGTERAIPLYERSLAIRRQVYAPDHPDLVTPLNNLADSYRRLGRFAEAETRFRTAIAICGKRGSDDATCGFPLAHLALLRAESGDCAEGARLADQALALFEQRSTKGAIVAEARMVLGACEVARGDIARGGARLRQVVAAVDGAGGVAAVDLDPRRSRFLFESLAKVAKLEGDAAAAERARRELSSLPAQ